LIRCRPRGGVPEWPKGSDCKSAGTAFEGSNPSPSTIFATIQLLISNFPSIKIQIF
jgi:hypothetical protein